MSYGLNVEMHKQTEICKRLDAIIRQVLPFLNGEHQQQVAVAVERAKQITMTELTALMQVSLLKISNGAITQLFSFAGCRRTGRVAGSPARNARSPSWSTSWSARSPRHARLPAFFCCRPTQPGRSPWHPGTSSNQPRPADGPQRYEGGEAALRHGRETET